MTTTWTAVFEANAYDTDWRDANDGLTPPDGRRLLHDIATALSERGWAFGEPFDEDHGWHAEAPASDGLKSIGVSLVVAPSEGDGTSRALGWRIVIGASLGLLGGTKRHRLSLLNRLAVDVSHAVQSVGGRAIDWQSGPLSV